MLAHSHTLQVAVNGAEELVLLNSYRNRTLIVLFIGLVLFTASTWFITRRGLRPIAALSRIVSQVEPNCMHPRVDVPHWPAELTGLACSFDLMLNRLEETFQSLQQFSADIAHELRTPLNILRGEAEVALAQTRTTEEYRELLASALEEYQRLSSLVESLLFLARAEHDSMLITKATLDARSEALAVCTFYEALAMERGVAVEVSGNGELRADSILLRRALSNLVSNSLRHTPANGIVRITIQDRNESGTDIVVSDSGSGIAKEHLPKILNRFYRVDTARARDGEGTGLGLAIVKSIMTLHSGTIAVRSAPGKGTTVVLSFP
jgi:two-component system heavy metal sensor histidine kinase CusS